MSESSIVFKDENPLVNIIRRNRFQFDKIIRSAVKGKLAVGVEVRCVFIDDFKFLEEQDYNKIIRIDRTRGGLLIEATDTGRNDIPRIFADGSYTTKGLKSGYGGMILSQDGGREVFSRSFYNGSSNLMELLAVTEGLKRLTDVDYVQINTDSRYVIRGLVQWIHFWKLNQWQTAFGKDVKFKEHWQNIDRLCENKIIEINWIKGHSGHEEQSFCHSLARYSASRFFGPLLSDPL